MLRFLIALLLANHHAVIAAPQVPPHDRLTEQELDAAAEVKENFDPSRANSYHNISCVGDSYDLRLPLQPGWNPNKKTVQQLCAKPQYSGGLPGQHAGGWCNHNEVMFDDSPDAQVNPQLANYRMFLGCRYRCFCNHNIPVENRNVQPKPSEAQTALQLKVNERESFMTYEVRLDVQNDFTTPPDKNKGSLGYDEVDVLQVSHFKEVQPSESLRRPHRDYISLDEGNKITCSGDLPTFQLPAPYTVSPPHSDFQNNQQLCAVQLNGGLLGANAGGYCHRSDRLDSTGTPLQTVWFSDEMTPRLDWTWGGGDFFASASIRLHCYTHCLCKRGKTDPLPTAKIWSFVEGHQLALRGSRQMVLEAASSSNHSSQESSSSSNSGNGGGGGGAGGSGGSSGSGSGTGDGGGYRGSDSGSYSGSGSGSYSTGDSVSDSGNSGGSGSGATSDGGAGRPAKRPKTVPMEILPPQDGSDNHTPAGPGSAKSGDCGSDHRQFCPAPWPTDLLGPIPSAPPGSTEVVRPGPAGPPDGPKSDLTVCGNQCQGPQDCGSPPGKDSGTEHQCVCAYPNLQDARLLGLDPVMPASICLVLVNLAFGANKLAVTGNLNGRDAPLAMDGRGDDWLCRCNATYAHNACCSSRDGMVWLD